MFDWIIIGGGLHGTHLSLVLTCRLGVPRNRICVLDPLEEPLANWRQYVSNTGMRHLRSSLVHHLDIDPYSLRDFSKSPAGRKFRDFKYPYHRPGTALFWRHCMDVIGRNALDGIRTNTSATGLEIHGNHLRVLTGRGALEASRVMIATGMGGQPCWPDWAAELKNNGANIHHLYERGFIASRLPAWDNLLVVGGGIGAAQSAVMFAGRAPGKVSLYSRHEPKIRQFDSDPGWNGPRLLAPFGRETDLSRRRGIIDMARYSGSIPPDVQLELSWYARTGKLTVLQSELESILPAGNGRVALTTDGVAHAFDTVVLASGFSSGRPGGSWLDRAVDNYGLPVSDCGYPVVDQSLHWQGGIYVCGPLAELELGPMARNISGARHAGHRLFKYLSR